MTIKAFPIRVGPSAVEDKYDQVRPLITIAKEKGYLLYDQVNELLPSELSSCDELDDELFNTFSSAGIEIIDSDQKYLRDEKPLERTGEGAEELEFDLTPGALDKTNDPVRMYGGRHRSIAPVGQPSEPLTIAAARYEGNRFFERTDIIGGRPCFSLKW